MRNPIDTIKNPKVKSVLITILEILVVAGIIFGVLMFIYSKVNKEADKTSGVAKQEETKISKKSTKYYIVVDKKWNRANIYKYTTKFDYNNKDVLFNNLVKYINCNVGKKVKAGTYKLQKTYSWIKTNKYWHKYNTQYGRNVFLQSCSYKNHYPNTMVRKSYNMIGEFNKNHKDKNIWFKCDDAKWIQLNAYRITLKVVKKNESFIVAHHIIENPKLAKECGWDPSDWDNRNPYHVKNKSNHLTVGLKTVIVEKGHKINYLDNIIARCNGKVVTKQLKYNRINKNKLGIQKVKYTYKKGKVTLSGIQMFKVVDTTPPKVTIANQKFKFELKSLDKKDVIKQSNIDKIKEMVRKAASCNEPNCVMNVQTVDKEDLNEGDISVVVTAKDKSGNVGAAQTFVKVKVKEDKGPKKKYKFPGQKKKHKKKKVVKKKHKKKTKKKKKKQVETETVIEE